MVYKDFSNMAVHHFGDLPFVWKFKDRYLRMVSYWSRTLDTCIDALLFYFLITQLRIHLSIHYNGIVSLCGSSRQLRQIVETLRAGENMWGNSGQPQKIKSAIIPKPGQT